jgi:hypothetical protein
MDDLWHEVWSARDGTKAPEEVDALFGAPVDDRAERVVGALLLGYLHTGAGDIDDARLDPLADALVCEPRSADPPPAGPGLFPLTVPRCEEWYATEEAAPYGLDEPSPSDPGASLQLNELDPNTPLYRHVAAALDGWDTWWGEPPSNIDPPDVLEEATDG